MASAPPCGVQADLDVVGRRLQRWVGCDADLHGAAGAGLDERQGSAACLAIQGSNNVNGSPAFQHDCIGSAADQHWNIEYITAGRSRIRNAYTGRCLAVQGANNVNGAPAFQHDCAGYEDQNWNIFDEGSGGRYVKIQNWNTQRCLIIRGANNYNGSPAFQFDCLNYPDQQWVFQTV